MYCMYVQGKYAKLNTVSSTYIHLVNSIKIIKINLDFKVIPQYLFLYCGNTDKFWIYL